MFEWDEYLVLAERLAAEKSDEAAQRSAISRASYAAYHAAARFVRDKGILTTRHRHRLVWEALADQADGDLSAIGARGNRLTQTRIEADYQTRFPGNLEERVNNAVADARDVIETLRRLA